MRQISHSQHSGPLLEYPLRELRFLKVCKYINNGSRVVDLGCGYRGDLLRRLSGKIKVGIGYDIAITRVDLPKNIILKKMDLNKKFETRKEYYDFITALAVIEHLNNPANFLKQVSATLKVGGKLIVTTPHRRTKPILEFLSYKLGLISKKEIQDHKTYFDENTLRLILKRAGLKIISLETFGLGLNLFAVAQKTN